jgi:hypothetical protein
MNRKKIPLLTGILCATLILTTYRDFKTVVAAQSTNLATTSIVSDATSQRNANYSIDVSLDTESRMLTGREVLTWRNTSNISTNELRFHLYYNAWKNPRSTWMRERLLGRGGSLSNRPESDWSWINVTSIRLLGNGDDPSSDLTHAASYIAPDDGNVDDQTVLVIPLPRQIEPRETVNLEIEWKSKIPRTFARTGTIGNYYFLAQWFPKIGVLEDTGWNCHQFHSATEFFSDYGIYDVRITVPEGWIVGATGVEQERRKNTNGTETHRYYQEDVHDFAWTTSPDFLDLKQRFEHPELPSVELRLLLRPEHRNQAERHFKATSNTLKHYGEWFGAYPYDHLTIVDPAWQSRSGGMEYPTFFTAGTRWLAPTDVSTPEHVTIHEAGHQFWYGVIGNNEFEYAWLDEGLNTFATGRVLEATFTPHYRSTRFFGRFVPWVFRNIPWSRAIDGNRIAGYRRNAKNDAPITPTFQYWPGTASSISYNKTALWLHTLERYLGWPVLREGMAKFYEQWKFDHPSPDDFFEAINSSSGKDMSWFFDQVHGTANVFDYGIQSFTSRRVSIRGFTDEEEKSEPMFTNSANNNGQIETTIVVRRYGEGVFPVEIVTEFANGERITEHWDGVSRWTMFKYEREARATRTYVDPKRVLLLDTNYTNNSRTLSPLAQSAATKWSLTWLIWLQDVLLTYGVFV